MLFYERDCATAHIATYSTNDLNKVFDDIVINHGLWSERVQTCDFYL
jgi:hypothetical protein